ncbi:hypothetical protein LIA77_11826 [Sarocladium implicatum]|nr:hypothetical protein LIA77_11826 [Sarocladium implicatum]
MFTDISQALLREAHAIKDEANTLFLADDYENALSRYLDSINTCPETLTFDRALLHSNLSACYLKLEQWKDAIKAATVALDGLVKFETEDPLLNPKGASESTKDESQGSVPAKPKLGDEEVEEVEEEIVSSGASRSAPAISPAFSEAQVKLKSRKDDVLRIRTKALLRRGRARSEEGGWQNLAGAEEDYRALSELPPGTLVPADARTVRSQLRSLPARAKAAQEQEMGEMWGKLRTLGDGILKPFGLSTNNFQMVKDEKTGGYSMNFTQGQPGDGSSS